MGNRLADARRARGWTQADLAGRLRAAYPECRATPNLISQWENGRATPSLLNGMRLASVLGETAEALFPLAPPQAH